MKVGTGSHPEQGATIDWSAFTVTYLSGVSMSLAPPSQTNRRLWHSCGAGDLPTGQHLPRGMGKSQTEGHRGGAEPEAQLCCAPNQVRQNARNSATSSSMLPTRPMAPQGQAPGLMVPGEETGGAGLVSDRPQQLASPSSSTPGLGVRGPPACPGPFSLERGGATWSSTWSSS